MSQNIKQAVTDENREIEVQNIITYLDEIVRISKQELIYFAISSKKCNILERIIDVHYVIKEKDSYTFNDDIINHITVPYENIVEWEFISKDSHDNNYDVDVLIIRYSNDVEIMMCKNMI